MAEMVSSAFVQETVSQILSGMVHKYEKKRELNAVGNLERLEMAHIKLGAALETSSKWLITDASLLRWRKKLKRTAEECDDTLHKCKQRVLEDEQLEQEVRSSSFPKRLAHATKSFVYSTFSCNKNELSRSTVQRFEWYADGASEFLRLMELGGTPNRHMPFGSLIKHLFAGKELQHKIFRGSEYPSILLSLVPFCAEYGIEAGLMFILEDGNAPEDNFYFNVMLQVSECTDIVGIMVKCLQLFPPHFKSTVEIITKELIQLPMLDFAWVPCVDSCQRKHWDTVHSFGTQWFRPNPLCCKQHDQHKLCHGSTADKPWLADGSLEPVIEVNLLCQVSLSEYDGPKKSLSEYKNYLQDYPRLKAGVLFMPHGSSEDMLHENKRSARAEIYGEEQNCLHIDTAFGELEEIMLPKAIHYFHQNAEATVYQLLWKSKNGTAYIQVEKASILMPSTKRTFRGASNGLLREDEELGSWSHLICQFYELWVKQAPIRLQGMIMDWIQTEKEKQSPTSKCLKF